MWFGALRQLQFKRHTHHQCDTDRCSATFTWLYFLVRYFSFLVSPSMAHYSFIMVEKMMNHQFRWKTSHFETQILSVAYIKWWSYCYYSKANKALILIQKELNGFSVFHTHNLHLFEKQAKFNKKINIHHQKSSRYRRVPKLVLGYCHKWNP